LHDSASFDGFGTSSNSPYVIGQDPAYQSGLYGFYYSKREIWIVRRLQIGDEIQAISGYGHTVTYNGGIVGRVQIEYLDGSIEILYTIIIPGVPAGGIGANIYFIKN
jgi:hypothetical protein